MVSKHWKIGLFGAALLFSFACQEQGTAPSEPTRSLEAALTAEEEALAEDIRRDIRCLYNHGEENAMLKRFASIVNKKEEGDPDPLHAQTGEVMAEVLEDFYDGALNDPPQSPCNDPTVEVAERLIINLAAFGELGTLEPGFLTEDGNSTIFTFDLQQGHTEILSSEFGDCIGVSFPIQMEENAEGLNTCTLAQPTTDPGFGNNGEGTAPFWITLQCLPFTGPYDPAIYTAWYVLDEDDGDESLDGFDPGDPVPAGVDVTACTIRDGVGLLCADPEAEEGDDLFQTTGELLEGALACDPGGASAMETEGFHGFVNNLFQPISRFAEVRPLWANPGNLGLRSSFSSDFGVQFDEGTDVVLEIGGATDPVTMSDGDSTSMDVSVTPVPDNEEGPEIEIFALGLNAGDVTAGPFDLDDGEFSGRVICDAPGVEADGNLVLTTGSYEVTAEFLGTESVPSGFSNTVEVTCEGTDLVINGVRGADNEGTADTAVIFDGDFANMVATVTPAPEGTVENALEFIVDPGTTEIITKNLIDGEATGTLECDTNEETSGEADADITGGTHPVIARFLGTEGFTASVADTVYVLCADPIL